MIILLILTVTVALCLAMYHYSWKTFSFFKNTGIPYIQPSPIVGNIGPVIFQRQHLSELLVDMYNRFPDAKYIGMFDFATPVLLIRDPSLIKSIGTKNFDNFSDHYGFTTEIDKIFANSLFSLRGQRWRDMRSLLSPCFTAKKLRQNFETITNVASEFVDDLLVDSQTGVDSFDMKDVSARFTSNINSRFFFGLEVNSTKNPENEVYRVGRKTFSFNSSLSLRFFLLKNFQWIVKTLGIKLFDNQGTTYLGDMIKKTMAAREEYDIVRPDLLQVLIDASKNPDSHIKVDIGDILSQTFIFFFGGFDTTSSYLSNTFYLLGTHPEVQTKLQQEIDSTMAETNGRPSYDAISAMKYLDAVVTEAGRLLGPVPYVERMCTGDYELPPAVPGAKPYTVRRGTTIYFPVYAVHRDPNVYENPLAFDPDRFLDKSTMKESGMYLPFGIGPRVCIAIRLALLEVKLLVFHVLAKASLRPTDKTHVPMQYLNSSFVLMSRHGIWLKLEKRD